MTEFSQLLSKYNQIKKEHPSPAPIIRSTYEEPFVCAGTGNQTEAEKAEVGVETKFEIVFMDSDGRWKSTVANTSSMRLCSHRGLFGKCHSNTRMGIFCDRAHVVNLDHTYGVIEQYQK